MSKCPNCSKPLVQTQGKRPRRFCNSTCRSNYWQKQSRKKGNPPSKEKETAIAKPILSGENEFMGVHIPEDLKGIALSIWKAEIKEKHK